jgi:hypothetical protein
MDFKKELNLWGKELSLAEKLEGDYLNDILPFNKMAHHRDPLN